MFKIGEAKTRGGDRAFIYEIDGDRMFGKYFISQDGTLPKWVAAGWDKVGSYVSGMPSSKDVMPNDLPKTFNALAFVTGSGIVHFAIENSTQFGILSSLVDVKRAPEFDIIKKDLK